MRRTTFRRRLVRTFALCLGMTGIFVSAAVAQVVDADDWLSGGTHSGPGVTAAASFRDNWPYASFGIAGKGAEPPTMDNVKQFSFQPDTAPAPAFPTMDNVKQFSFQPDTAPTATVDAPTVAPISNPGFDWGDAGIGAAIALALAAMLIAGWRTLNRRPDQPAGV